MGMWGSSHSFSESYKRNDCGNKYPNPNPNNFSIIRYKEHGNFLVLEINYPDCTNFEGNKIIVFKNKTINDIKSLSYLDPHFTESGDILARFIPTENGWELANGFASNLTLKIILKSLVDIC